MKFSILAALLFPAFAFAAALEDYSLDQKTWGRTTFKTTEDVAYRLRMKDGESFYGAPCEKLNDDDFENDYSDALSDARQACNKLIADKAAEIRTCMEQNARAKIVSPCEALPQFNLSENVACAQRKALEALKIDPICKSSKAPKIWVSAFFKASKNKKCLMELFLQSAKKNAFPDSPNLSSGAELKVSGDVRLEDERNVIPMTVKRTDEGKSKLLGKANFVCLPDTDIEEMNDALSDFGIPEGLKLEAKPVKKQRSSEHAISRGTASEKTLETAWPPKKKK